MKVPLKLKGSCGLVSGFNHLPYAYLKFGRPLFHSGICRNIAQCHQQKSLCSTSLYDVTCNGVVMFVRHLRMWHHHMALYQAPLYTVSSMVSSCCAVSFESILNVPILHGVTLICIQLLGNREVVINILWKLCEMVQRAPFLQSYIKPKWSTPVLDFKSYK